jgi:transposase
MTTTDIAVIEHNEVAEPLTPREAKALDKKVRSTSDKVSKGFATLDDTIENLGNLIQEAIDGQIHKGLGLKSWTAWVKDAVQVTVPDRFQRKELVRELSKNGMSQRAIATVFNVSQKTVDRDLDGEDVEEGATVVSLDGAKRPKNKPDYIDVEAEEVEEDSADDEAVEPMKAVDIVAAFDEETASLYAAQNELTLLAQEEKWEGARRRVAKADLQNLKNVAGALDELIENLSNVDS